MVRLLVEHGADIRGSDHVGWTPLMHAVDQYVRHDVHYTVVVDDHRHRLDVMNNVDDSGISVDVIRMLLERESDVT